MNIPKFQQQIQAQRQQSNIQAQQILLQQLQQGQSQQQYGANGTNGNQQMYMNSYQRAVQGQQPQSIPNMSSSQNQFQGSQYTQQSNHSIQGNQSQSTVSQAGQFQQDITASKATQKVQAHLPQYQSNQQPPHMQHQQYYGQQVNSMQPSPAQNFCVTNVDNPNTIYWQHQQQLSQLSRNSNIPHLYARQYAANSRKGKNPYNEVKSITLVEAAKSVITVLKEQDKLKNANSGVGSSMNRNRILSPDMEDDEVQEAERLRRKTHGKQLWCQLDLSGQGLVNVSPKLFQYDFLESLYLSNNKLTSIPSEISKLRSLRTLDLSGNRITEINPKLGMCFNLRYLFLFDNEIRTIPIEFGHLIELLFLGIEGNPLDPKLANILAEEGTEKLISFLCDQNPVRVRPKERAWLTLDNDGEVVDETESPGIYEEIADSKESDEFTLMSYNTLCQHYATSRLYKYTPSWALDWNFRREEITKEILKYQSDVVCLQEVETRTYQEYWVPLLHEHGYKSTFFCKTRSKTMGETDAKKVDGCATFYKSDKFDFLMKQNFEYNSVCMGSDKYKKTKDLFNRFMNKDQIALLTFLRHKASGESILIANTHLHWDPEFNDVKALQVGILLEELEDIMKKFSNKSTIEEIRNLSMIICGDFNSVRDSAVYHLFSTGSVSTHADLDGRDYGRFTDEGFKHVFKLRSAYDDIGELPLTTLTPTFTDVIEYIWYSTPTLRVKGLLGKVDEEYVKHCIGFPNADFPSDHIPLVSRFQVKRSQSSKKPDFKPDFKVASSRKT